MTDRQDDAGPGLRIANPPIVRQADDLVTQIKGLHACIVKSERDNLRMAKDVGEKLLALQEECQRADPQLLWLKTLEKTGVPQKTAYNYMDVAKAYREGSSLVQDTNLLYSEVITALRAARKDEKEKQKPQDDPVPNPTPPVPQAPAEEPVDEEPTEDEALEEPIDEDNPVAEKPVAEPATPRTPAKPERIPRDGSLEPKNKSMILRILQAALRKYSVSVVELAEKLGIDSSLAKRHLGLLADSRGYIVTDLGDGEYRVRKAVHFAREDQTGVPPDFRRLMKELYDLAFEAFKIDNGNTSANWSKQERSDFLNKVMKITKPLSER